jgi:membrane carboxypeptidase/penicillin-binding protein
MDFRYLRLDFVHSIFFRRPRLLVSTIAVLAVVLFLVGGWTAWFSYDLTARLPNKEALKSLGDMAQSTAILDASDKPAFTIFKEQRIEVPLEKISPNFITAVISVEDQRFYEHSGVDGVRVAAAVIRNFEEGRRAEGGSTITQQLARQSFLTRDKTYRRKLQEVIIAAYIEKMYDKNDILELYLNKVYFGGGLYGAEAAARGYFGKPASDLSVDEGALLAGLIQSPSSYAPTVNLDRAVARRNIVLQSMLASRAIEQATADRAKNAPVRLVNGLEISETFGLYFKEQVRRELVERFGSERVYQGGLRVYTTLDPKLQQAAETLVEKRLAEIEHRHGFKHAVRGKAGALKEGELPAYLQGALVAMDPTTGYVRAMVGGRDFD